MKKVKKIVLILLVLSLLAGTFALRAKQADASFYFLKEFIIKPLVRKLANALENKLVNKIHGLASGLSQKTPNFVTNWRNYTLDSQGRGNDVFRSVLADANLCPYFKDQARTAFGASSYTRAVSGATVKNSQGQVVFQNKTKVPGLPSFQNITNCSLDTGADSCINNCVASRQQECQAGPPDNRPLCEDVTGDGVINEQDQGASSVDCRLPDVRPDTATCQARIKASCENQCPKKLDVQSFNNDFTKGGWNAWNKLIQPQNNFFGVYSLALNEQQKQISTDNQSARDYSVAAQGFLGQKLGRNNKPGPTGCTGAGQFGNTNNTITIDTRCIFQGKEITPAKLFGESAADAIDKKLGRVGGASELTDIVLNLLNAVVGGLTNRILNFSGLSGYDTPANPAASDFDTTDANPASAETAVNEVQLQTCLAGCNDDQQLCLNLAGNVCNPGQVDPATGTAGPTTCGPDPNQVNSCNSRAVNCRNTCRGV